MEYQALLKKKQLQVQASGCARSQYLDLDDLYRPTLQPTELYRNKRVLRRQYSVDIQIDI